MAKENKKFDKFLADRAMNSSVVQLQKIGHITRTKANKKAGALSDFLINQCKSRNIKLSYDITYGGKPHELRYSEFFGGLGGIQINSCDGNMVRRMYNAAYDESKNIDFAERLELRTIPNNDKYKLHTYDIDTMKGLVILPGSNCIEDVVNKEKLNAAMLLGAKVCLHPITNGKHKEFIKEQYGEENVLPTMYSGYNAMLNANCIYATGTSELALYAMLLGKPVISIATGVIKGGYVDAFSRAIDAPDQKAELNQLLNNPSSGIILPQPKDLFPFEAIVNWLDIYESMMRGHDSVICRGEVPPLKRYTAV